MKTLGRVYRFDITVLEYDNKPVVEEWHVHALTYEQACKAIEAFLPVSMTFKGESE